MLGLFFYPEDGGSKFLRNVVRHIPQEVISILCGIYEITQLVRSLLKRRNVLRLEGRSAMNNKITFSLNVPPYSLVDTYQLVGEIYWPFHMRI
jgi:hypothetical protein